MRGRSLIFAASFKARDGCPIEAGYSIRRWYATLSSATPDDVTLADLAYFTGDVKPIGAEWANGPEPGDASVVTSASVQ
jgi:hypothetical protein